MQLIGFGALTLCYGYLSLVHCLPETVKIVGIFDENISQQTYDAFRYALQGVNEGRRNLALRGTTLVPRIVRDFKADLFTGPQQGEVDGDTFHGSK